MNDADLYSLRFSTLADKIHFAIFITLLVGAGIYIYYDLKKKKEEELKKT